MAGAVLVMAAPVLSPREIEVLVALSAGMTTKQAQAALGISESRWRDLLRGALRKLDARTREHAVAIFAERRSEFTEGRPAA